MSLQCCEFEKGTYQYGIDGAKKYESKMQETCNSVGIHKFKVPLSSSIGSGSSQLPIESKLNDVVEHDDAWLQAQNMRRKKYHEQWGKRCVPLTWSPMLANRAKQWANQLATICDDITFPTLGKAKLTVADHKPNIPYGERIIAN